MKLKKWGKTLLIIIGVIFLLLCILIGIFIYKDLQMEEKLNREIEEIQDIINATDFNEEAYKDKLNKTVTTGDYYKVERAYKNYLRDYLKINNSITEFYDQMHVDDLLTIDNIISDGKDFLNTKVLLESYSKQLDQLKEKFDAMSDEEKVLTYIDDKLDDYYINYFKDIIGDVRQTEEEKELSSYLATSSTLLRNTRTTFDFLSENKDHWTVDMNENMILFDSETLLKEYQDLLTAITNLYIDDDKTDSNTSRASDV